MQAPPGQGKSLASLALFSVLRKKLETDGEKSFGKVLIICKTKAINVFDPAIGALKLNAAKLDGGAAVINLFAGSYGFPNDIYIMSTTVLTKIVMGDNRKAKLGFVKFLANVNLLVIDEIHTYRNYTAKLTQAVRFMSNCYQKFITQDCRYHRILGVTATPVFKDVTNLHALFAIIDPTLLGSYKAFTDAYCVIEEHNTRLWGKVYSRNGSHAARKSASFQQIVGFKNLDVLQAKVAPYLFTWRNNDFTFDYNIFYYELTDEEKANYNSIIDGLGLDKKYSITLDNGVSKFAVYRDLTDIFYRDDKTTVQVRVADVHAGMVIFYDGQMCKIESIMENKVTAGYSVRCIKALLAEGVVADRLEKIGDLVAKYDGEGVLINNAYHNTIDATELYLHGRFPGRRIVKLTGRTVNFSGVFRTVNWDRDIVLLSRAAGESLDMYVRHIILSDIPTNPGALVQLLGRLSRHNSKYRDFTVDIMLNGKSTVTAYFYERLRLLLMGSDYDFATFDKLPVSHFLTKYSSSKVDIKFLKRHLLWRKVRL
jgi:hypothetical protein